MTNKPKYWLLSLVKVDRGMIPTGAKRMNGDPIMGQHIPYYAGLVIQERSTSKRYFLDSFNSEILLRDYLGYTSMTNRSPSLVEMVKENEFIMKQTVGLVIVKDLDSYIKTNKLIKKRRNAEEMHRIAKDIRSCDFC